MTPVKDNQDTFRQAQGLSWIFGIIDEFDFLLEQLDFGQWMARSMRC